MKNRMRWPVFIPAFLFVLLVAIIGVVSNQTLSDVSNKFFVWSLESFGWFLPTTLYDCTHRYICNYVL